MHKSPEGSCVVVVRIGPSSPLDLQTEPLVLRHSNRLRTTPANQRAGTSRSESHSRSSVGGGTPENALSQCVCLMDRPKVRLVSSVGEELVEMICCTLILHSR